MHNVNATSTAFGNGIFDGWSIVTGNEYSEAVTERRQGRLRRRSLSGGEKKLGAAWRGAAPSEGDLASEPGSAGRALVLGCRAVRGCRAARLIGGSEVAVHRPEIAELLVGAVVAAA